jgi:hypothetical protein
MGRTRRGGEPAITVAVMIAVAARLRTNRFMVTILLGRRKSGVVSLPLCATPSGSSTAHREKCSNRPNLSRENQFSRKNQAS